MLGKPDIIILGLQRVGRGLQPAWLVKRISYLANKDETRSFSVLRFTLHEIRATKAGTADRQWQQKRP